MKERVREIIKCLKNGERQSDIARKFGVSRQRVCQLGQRENIDYHWIPFVPKEAIEDYLNGVSAKKLKEKYSLPVLRVLQKDEKLTKKRKVKEPTAVVCLRYLKKNPDATITELAEISGASKRYIATLCYSTSLSDFYRRKRKKRS